MAAGDQRELHSKGQTTEKSPSEVIPMIRLEDWSKYDKLIIRKMTRQKNNHIYLCDNVGNRSKKMMEQRQHRILITDWIS